MAAVVVEATTPHAAALKYKTRNRNINDGASCGRNEDGISSSSHSLESGPRSPRSLISEVEQDGCNISWGRTLDSLRPTNHSKYISKPLKTQHHFSTIQYEVTTETTMDSNKDTGPSVNDSKLSTLVVNCDSWYGTVAIGQEVSEPGFSLSPETRSKTTLKYLEVPITPPLSKKKNSSKGRSPKKQHRKQSRKFTGDMTPPNSPVLLWGDYGSTHNSASLQKRNETLDDPDSPGRTPRRRLKAKFRLDNALLGEVEQATWEELLVSTHAEESPQTDSFSRLILEIASYNHSSVGKKRLSDANPLVTCAGGSFLGRFHATYSKRKEQDDGSEQGLESVSRMLFDDDDSFQSVSSDIIDMGGEVEEQKSKCRLLRFADEQGLPIAKIKVVGDENDPYASSRIIVLFLDPVAKKFEFMQGHFSHKARPTVSDLLLQLPGFATEEKFREQEFVSMYGTSDGPRQLAPKDPLHELNLGKREVAVAVMKGASGERLVKDAAPLLTNKTIMRAVSMDTEWFTNTFSYVLKHQRLVRYRLERLVELGVA